jgi:hypothetical protein
MSEAVGSNGTATILSFPQNGAPGHKKPVLMAPTVELYSKTFPTRQQLTTLLRSWLFAAERDGVTLRQPEYAKALKRAISALDTSQNVLHATARLRSQEARLIRARTNGMR